MEQAVNIQEVDKSNILVREEEDEAITNVPTLPVQGEQPGHKPPVYRLIAANIVPILKALVIITLFLLDGIGFSPLGCKTQYLMSSRFWYNKQMVIFFIIYFIINLGADTVSKLTDPLQQLIISVACLLFYNVVARLGDVWWAKNPWYWPGPMTYFAIICLPLVSIVILDDMRRYYMAENAVFVNVGTIDKIKFTELIIIGITLLLIALGFGKALIQSKEIHGKYFSFLAFFFGVPMGDKKTGKIEKCDNKMLRKIGREVKLARMQPYTSNASVLYKVIQGLLISVAVITLGYFMIYKQTAGKIWKIFKNEYRNASMDSGGIS